MLKRLAWLSIALLLVSTATVQAADRHTAPDAYDTNVIKILRTTNKAQTNSYVPLVFEMKNNNPFNVLPFLRRPVQLEEGDLFTFVNDTNDGGLVLFVVPKYMEGPLRDLVARLDKEGVNSKDGTSRYWKPLKHRRASSSDGDFLNTAASFSTGNGSAFLTDPEVNGLFFEDAASGADSLAAALDDWLDVPTASALFEVSVYELTARNDGKIGLDYINWKNTQGSNLFAIGGYKEYGEYGRNFGGAAKQAWQPLGVGAAGLPGDDFAAQGYNYAYRYAVTSEFFDYLAVKQKAKVLNKSKIAALNGRPALLAAGNQIVYYRVDDVADGSTDGVRNSPFDENDTRDVRVASTSAGVEVELLPTISDETIELSIDISWDNFNGFAANGSPSITSSELSTDVRLGVDEEIVLGGMNRQVEVKSTQKVPILGSLPILGWVFGGENSQNQNSEVIVAVKPTTIMDYASEYGVSSDDQSIIDQTNGTAEVTGLENEAMFDQYWADPDKYETSTLATIQ